MNRPRRATWRRAATIAVVVVCVGYAPIAMTELWPYAHQGAPAFGEWLLGRAVSPRYVADALATRIGPYGRSLAAMIFHSVLGGVLMLLGPAQLISAIRRRRRLHRVLGVVFALTVYASMAGAAIYLARTAPREAFSGPAFWIVLATILVGTVMSVTFGILAAIGNFPDLHQRWMLLCYAYLMTAPLLRLEWGALPTFLPGLSMADVNRVAIMHLGAVVAFGALVASRAMDKRDAPPGVRGTWVPTPVLVAAHVAGASALGWLVKSAMGWGSGGSRLMAAYLVPFAAAYATMFVCQRRAGRDGRSWAREEWRLHLVALCLAPPFSAVAGLLFEHYADLDRPTALAAGIAIGCGMLAFAATAVVSVRVMVGREVLKRERLAAAPRPDRDPAPVG
ncbi:DUF2306 domain-containing protein [Streptomyces noursei]|uniref:DUF2306 domain-containing protein n=1 Tax=Streptomyces noursei TaxID=1971 RepID=A0A2N8P873_STRNR|nr:DUF2306 domain-containing protein [Streptomyces noursei]PNE37224.1 hypothetical protein AOB60_22840 [Streptomyces noursei]